MGQGGWARGAARWRSQWCAGGLRHGRATVAGVHDRVRLNVGILRGQSSGRVRAYLTLIDLGGLGMNVGPSSSESLPECDRGRIAMPSPRGGDPIRGVRQVRETLQSEQDRAAGRRTSSTPI